MSDVMGLILYRIFGQIYKRDRLQSPQYQIIIKPMKSIEAHKQKFTDRQSIFRFLKHFQNQKAKSLTPLILPQLQTLTNQQNNWTLLHTCANNNNIEMIKYYLEEHRKIMETDGSQFNVSSKLAWINRKDKEGFTCLHYAVFRGGFALVQLLEENGADIYQVNGEGLTIVHIAAQADSPVFIYYFLSKGLKIDVKDFKGNTPLHWACYSGMENSTAALISWQAQLDKRQDNYGMTPLHLAVMSGNSHIVKRLLIKGCDRNVVSYTGKRPIDIARQNSYLNIIDMINDKRGVCQIFSFKPPYRKPQKYGVHFFLFLAFFLSTYLLNIATFVVYFDTNKLLTIGLCLSYIVWGAATFFLFLSLLFSNPGKLTNRIHRHRQFFQKLLTKKPSTLCFDCGIIKPQRSKHCQICQSCISVFDHHCPWLANCVGSENFALFYAFIVMIVIFILLTFAVAIAEIIEYEVVGVLSIVNSVYGIVLGLIFIVPLILLLTIQTKNAIQDRTTYQHHIKKHPSLHQSRKQAQRSNTSKSNASQISKSLKSYNVQTDSLYRSSVSKETSHTEEIQSNKWVQNCISMCCENRNNLKYKIAY